MQHQDLAKSKSAEFVKCLADFFQRELISVPLSAKRAHQQFSQRCGQRAASLELDTAAYPNIEYIAGNRLSVYPVNPQDQVSAILKHLVDDIQPARRKRTPTGQPGSAQATTGLSAPWSNFVKLNGKDSLRLALLYLYDIMMAPSRDLLRIMADCCSDREQRARLLHISSSDEHWDRWICQALRTLKSTLDEFTSCKLSAKALISELSLQQPRQYSISSIKSSNRFRTEITVIQHRFNTKHIALSLQIAKERHQQDLTSMQTHPRVLHVNHNPPPASKKSTNSMRSIRSVVAFAPSPISMQQVQKVPAYSGPLMSLYAAASLASSGSQVDLAPKSSTGSSQPLTGVSQHYQSTASSQSAERTYDGLCSSYLMSLQPNDHIVCEFVENPRFTLKGNRERPIMMIGQDVGVIAFRPFWQQRALEHDRAQLFYDLFKDLPPKKFGDMQLILLSGNKCKVEDLFKSEIQAVSTSKVLSSVTRIDRKLLLDLLEHAAVKSSGAIGSVRSLAPQVAAKRAKASKSAPIMKLQIESKELIELGDRIFKLLVDNNGCLYTCCDAQMTQALEILLVESILRHSNGKLSREKIMTTLMPKWKGRRTALSGANQAESIIAHQQPLATNNNNNQFLFTLENPFERAQIVQEIYDSSI